MENTQNLIGRKFKGFKFESTNELSYVKELDKDIDKILTIEDVCSNDVYTNYGLYPLKEVLNHLIPEETEIPELPEGVLMLVSDDGMLWRERYVIAKRKDGQFVAWHEDETELELILWGFCKPIPKLPNYTLQELKEKIGHDFNLID